MRKVILTRPENPVLKLSDAVILGLVSLHFRNIHAVNINDTPTQTPREGLTQALKLLIFGVAFLGPMSDLGTLTNEINEAKRLYPEVETNPLFQQFVSSVYTAIGIEWLMGLAIALLLYIRRQKYTPAMVVLLLWARLALFFGVLFITLSRIMSANTGALVMPMIQSVFWALIWTAYLLISKTVKCIYQ